MKMLKAQRKLVTDTLEMLLSELTGHGQRRLSYKSTWKQAAYREHIHVDVNSPGPTSDSKAHLLVFQKLYYQDWGGLSPSDPSFRVKTKYL